MAGSAAQVYETSLSQEDDVAAGGHGEAVNLGLDVDGLLSVLLEPGDVDLNVEVTNVGNDSVLGHDFEVLRGDDVPVTGGGDEDVTTGSSLLHGGHLITGHRSLESVDGVDLGDNDASTVGLQGLSALHSSE